MNVTLHIDGGARGNPGPAGAGVVIRDAATTTPIYEAGIFLGRATNNVAEYKALVIGLQRAVEFGVSRIEIFSDSELLVKQITGEYRVKSEVLQPLNAQAQKLLLKLDSWAIKHVPRAMNARADELANLCMDAKKDVVALDFGTLPEPAAKPQQPQEPEPPQDKELCPRWSVTLSSIGDEDCPASCPVGKAFEFGPATPEGLCIHAAQAVFDDEPMFWPDRGLKHATAHCARCRADIRIEMQD